MRGGDGKESHPSLPRWADEVYWPVVAAIPGELMGRLAPAELFHEVLEHRWFLSETAGHDVATMAAARSYCERVLPAAPGEVAPAVAVGGLL